jgi:hypothetical protein
MNKTTNAITAHMTDDGMANIQATIDSEWLDHDTGDDETIVQIVADEQRAKSVYDDTMQLIELGTVAYPDIFLHELLVKITKALVTYGNASGDESPKMISEEVLYCAQQAECDLEIMDLLEMSAERD